jgi:predicted GNAT family N-acyltransferase
MSSAGVDVREVRDGAELEAALALRHAVFVGEQDVPVALEADGLDGEATHLVAVQDGVVLATCRLLTTGATVHLGRLAVAASARRRGLAARLLEVAAAAARARSARRIVLSAQTYATALYLAAGYELRGEPYLEAGIEHVEMELPLA